MTNYSFLFSSERSGTNLVTRMLDSNPAVCGPPPSHMIRTFSRNIGKYGDLQRDENWKLLSTDIVDFLAAQLGRWKSTFDLENFQAIKGQRSLGSIVRFVYETEMNAHGKSHVFVKENQLYTFAPFVLTEFPESRFIYLVRDPRDVALSWKRSRNHPGGVRRAMDVWLRDQHGFVELTGFLSSTGRVGLIRYEDLIGDPERSLEIVANHVGVRFSEEMLSFHKDQYTRENASRISNWENLAKPVLSGNSQKFKQGLTEEEIAYVESRCSDLMRFFDYEPHSQRRMNDDELHAFEDTVPADEIIEHSPEEQQIRRRREAIIRRIVDRPIMRSEQFLA